MIDSFVVKSLKAVLVVKVLLLNTLGSIVELIRSQKLNDYCMTAYRCEN